VLDEVRELVNGHAVVGQGRPKTESSFGVRSRISVSPTASPKASTLLIALEGTRCTSTERRNGPQLATSGEAAALARLVRMYSRSPEDTSVSTFVSVTSIGPASTRALRAGRNRNGLRRRHRRRRDHHQGLAIGRLDLRPAGHGREIVGVVNLTASIGPPVHRLRPRCGSRQRERQQRGSHAQNVV
jgi:hypothetical protein